jgi:N-acyl-D-amino-acid deacylase
LRGYFFLRPAECDVKSLGRPLGLRVVRLAPATHVAIKEQAANNPLGLDGPSMQRFLVFGVLRLLFFAAGLAFGTAQADEPLKGGAAAEVTDPRLDGCHKVLAEFFARHEIPGASVAITNQGRLAYAAGFGVADPQRQERVTPTSLFRIASVSKPITAVAILQLVERGRLSLDDRVFDRLKVEPCLTGGSAFDERQHRITIRHLLQHRGGWDREQSLDPMFQSVRFAELLNVPPPAEPDHIIRVMLGRKLDFNPGQRYAYSNFGYCLLGRVIEAVTGIRYEQYVQDQVLAPLGIRAMRVGKTRLEGRCDPSEVRYEDPGQGPSVFARDRGQAVPRPYGAFYLEAMDAHGGWLASAVDLARFAAAFDDPDRCPILGRTSIDQMYARPPGASGDESDGDSPPVYYSLGWQNRVLEDGNRINHWHNGSLPGTLAILIRRHDGRNLVALLNTRSSPRTESLMLELDRVLHQAANAVESWPEIDLFPVTP